jgi:ABC-2 type transport system ATP-binding protein
MEQPFLDGDGRAAERRRWHPPGPVASPAEVVPQVRAAPAEAVPGGTPPDGPDGHAVHARALTKTYGDHRAVDGIDLTVGHGEIFGFVGPNGAGKTTAVGMLCALLRPTSGHARVVGADVVTQRQRVRRQVGLLLQHTAVDGDLTLEQHLRLHARLHQLSRRQARTRIAALLETTGLADRRRDKVATLSGGLHRRLEIARALLPRPRLLFLDEPTTGLDPLARAHIWDHLAALRADTRTTLFVTTHHLVEAEHCDRIAIIDQGRIVASGTPGALKAALDDDRIAVRTDDDTAALALLERDHRWAVGRENGGLALRARHAAATVPGLCAALTARGLTIRSLATVSPTLDDVYLHHTGRSMPTDAPDPS